MSEALDTSGEREHTAKIYRHIGENLVLDAQLVERLTRPRTGLLVGSLLSGLLVLVLLWCWGYQIRTGLGVAGINRPVFWGVYVVTFVFWIGISHAGTLISAILRVTGSEWRRPVTRCAEAITVFALCVGALFPLIHLGRVWKLYYLIPFPNHRHLWPNFRSPLVWDMAAIGTYLTGSLLYLALPMLPDLALLRDRSRGGQRRFYALLALGWRGTQRQWRALEAGIRVLAVVIIPVAVSVHTIVSWDFAMTMTPGWKSTIFGPYFVVGAIYSGIAVLMIAMALLRLGMRLEDYLTDRVFSRLGLLFLTMTLLWSYFTFAEHLTLYYGGDAAEDAVHHELFGGRFAGAFWSMVACNVAVPLLLLTWPRGRRPLGSAVAGASVLAGMWLERFLIVVPALGRPRLPYTQGFYAPTVVELGILAGSIGLFGFLYFTFTRVFPILAIWEIREGWERAALGAPGEARVPSATSRHAGAEEPA